MLQESPIGETIPKGIKENVLFVPGNEETITRPTYEQISCYADDCWAWSCGSSKIRRYLISESNGLDYVDKKGEQYFKYVKGKCVCLEPQPVNNIIVFKRYYCCLKRDQLFQKHVSVVISCPDKLNCIKNVSVVEYVGNYLEHNLLHGNSKKAVGDYVCTSCSIKQKLADMIATNKRPREIYEELALDRSSSAPRDLKQVQNAKYNTGKKMRIDKGHIYKNNIADKVQALLTDIHANQKEYATDGFLWIGKTMKLPALVDRLYKIVMLQQVDCRRALYGQGNYELAPWMAKLQVQHVQWTQKTKEEKENLFKLFQKGLPPKKNMVSSTDGCLEVPKTARIARKLGQRRRTKSCKTLNKPRTE